jgi:hypothetical protein
MLTDPCAPRNLVRKRIIRRNVNYPSMKSFYVLGTLAGLALLPVTFAMVFAVYWLVHGCQHYPCS